MYISPQIDKTKTLLAEKAQYSEALSQTDQIKSIRDDKLIAYRAISEENLNRLKKMIPANADNVRLSMDINNIASKHSILISSIKVEDPGSNLGSISSAPSNSYNTATLNFSFKSSYSNFLDFIKDLENNLRISDIASISIKGNDAGVYNFSMSVKTYWLK